ncbi:MAG: NAD(P)/FAD-dependent oxidoreductase [Ruminococcaceae bacterium]|nr:NAD(P)/FAD-dependent oxidoreductase [Oscillospiraceae bacterium]
MKKRIIVAGGGHGGIATAMLLAKNGFDVTVFEKNSRENMGHDWTDIFDKKGFTCLGLPLPDESLYKFKHDMTFYGMSMRTPVTQHVPEDQLEIQMERKDIYNHLITHAEKAGVKFVFGCTVNGPVMLGSRVVGIKTDKGDEYAELVIDACGIHSPVRRNLPPSLGIQNEVGDYEQFFVYRAFFNKTAEVDDVDKYKVILLPENKKGISWVATEEEWTDVLIGRFHKFDMAEVERTIDVLRRDNPSLGTEKLRGGQFVNIPVRQPLGILVADGYAAIGDSAFMTVPIIGSGIANTLKASKILAEAIMKDSDMAYTAETLWEYQKGFYKALGNGLAPMACIKMMMARMTGDDIDYLLSTGVLNEDDMTITADTNSLWSIFSYVPPEIIMKKAKALMHNPKIVLKAMFLVKNLSKAIASTAVMPEKYDKKAVLKWVRKYNDSFKM